jgi:arylsulfatase A-like enzyme
VPPPGWSRGGDVDAADLPENVHLRPGPFRTDAVPGVSSGMATWTRLTATILAIGAVSALETGAARPNIINIVLDDQGARDAGWCGSRYYETPAMDRLAGQGVVCTAGYASGANCMPTRAALMTGQYAPRTGIYTVGSSARGEDGARRLLPVENRPHLDGRVVTWAEALQAGGYATCHIGKWHLGGDAETRPQAQGFLTSIAGGGNGQPTSYFAPWRLPDLPEGVAGEHLSDALATAATGWLRQQAGKGPFALNLWLYAVHSPVQPRADDAARFAGRPGPGGTSDAAYAGLLYGADRAVGQVMDELDRLGLAENTLVVLTSDNGGLSAASNAPLRGTKGMLYEGGIRVPLAVRWPKRIAAGTTCTQPILSMDLHATFLAAAGVAQPAGQPCDGIDVLPALAEGRDLGRPAVHWHLPCYLQGGRKLVDGRRDPQAPFRTTPVGAIRMGSLKLLEYFDDGGLELYDLAADPGEASNLAAERPEEAQRLLGEMRRWRAGIGAPVPSQRDPSFREGKSAGAKQPASDPADP